MIPQSTLDRITPEARDKYLRDHGWGPGIQALEGLLARLSEIEHRCECRVAEDMARLSEGKEPLPSAEAFSQALSDLNARYTREKETRRTDNEERCLMLLAMVFSMARIIDAHPTPHAPQRSTRRPAMDRDEPLPSAEAWGQAVAEELAHYDQQAQGIGWSPRDHSAIVSLANTLRGIRARAAEIDEEETP
jgi:hypothetical protein